MPISKETGKFTTENGHAPTEDKFTPEFIKSLRIDPEYVPEAPPDILRMNKIPMCTLGNFSLLIGKAKSRKSMFAGECGSQIINPTDVIMMGDEGVCGVKQLEKQPIIYIDTEQGNYHAAIAANRIARKTGKPEMINYITLRSMSTAERAESIEKIIQTFPDCPFIILDGLRDIAVKGINDEEEATMNVDNQLRITKQYNVHIMNVLHQNKGDYHARGHLGAEFTNKSESVIEVSKDEQNKHQSIIKPYYTRGDLPDPLSLILNEEKLPEIISYSAPEKGRKGVSPEDFEEYQHMEILGHVFKKSDEFSYTALWPEIKTAVNIKLNQSIGEKKAKTFLTYYFENGYIVKKDESKNSPYVRIPF